VPPDAEEFIGPEYRLTIYPERVNVQWSATSRPVAELIAEIRERTRSADKPVLRWWVNGHTTPSETPAALAEHGFQQVETVEVLARKLDDTDQLRAILDVPQDVVVRPADDPDSIRRAAEIDAEIFGWPPPTPRQLADDIRLSAMAAASGIRPTRRYLAYLDDEPIGSAGYTLADDVLRLWGAGVLPSARGRGAYRALLLARCLDGVEQGGSLALVKGRAATSAPVLRRAGFLAYGTELCFQETLS
jgi:hypothetical protein